MARSYSQEHEHFFRVPFFNILQEAMPAKIQNVIRYNTSEDHTITPTHESKVYLNVT